MLPDTVAFQRNNPSGRGFGATEDQMIGKTDFLVADGHGHLRWKSPAIE
jgi:hypothetical protein